MEKKILIILLGIIANLANINAQQHDKTWIVGYAGANMPSYPNNGTTFLHFEDTMRLEKKIIQMDYSKTNICMSDRAGNLLFTSNMARVMGKDGKYVLNGDVLLKGKSSDYNYGYNVSQGMLALPMPADTNKYMLIYNNSLIFNSFRLYTSIFDKSIGTNGGIIAKNDTLLQDTIGIGRFTAVKHGNGRDWWVRIGSHKPFHYIFLLDPNGLSLKSKQYIGYKLEEGLGQAVFSPDGKRFVETNGIDKKLGMDIGIYDFDRCSGLLSNYKRVHFDTANFNGCAISPNSRFLYFSNGWQLLQYDLEATDIKESETLIAVWDGFIDFSMTGFLHMQLAPDGKIYIATNGSTRYMHTINKPDEKGKACDLQQHNIKLFNYYARSIPNNPNYRLGALKGSPCDTLNSIATKNIDNQYNIKIFPNPAQDILNIQFSEQTTADIVLRSIEGKILRKITIQSDTQLDISDLPNGLLFVEVWIAGRRLKGEKIVVIH